jgi:hypothetical protein
MADTEECGDRAYFWRDDVMAIHSEMTRDIGSTATETGRLLYCMRDMCPLNRREWGAVGAGDDAAAASIVNVLLPGVVVNYAVRLSKQ